jgi:hypothetical protein
MFAKRIIRYLCLDKNPLRRGVDVIEAWLTVIFAAVLLAGPFVARDMGNALYVNQLSGKDAVLQDAVSVEPGATYEAAWSGLVGGVMAMLGVAAVAFWVWRVARRSLDRRRAAAWKAAWGSIEPEWSGRR